VKHLAAAAAAAIAISALSAGCGLGAGHGTSDVSLTVTRSFGASKMAAITQNSVAGSETVMRMLERSFHVQTRFGGGFVQAINGAAGDSSRHDWFYYVNGVEAGQGAASTTVHKGDRIWWDLHDWTVTDTVPAVVGSFPEPFLHGLGGKRLPTTLECAADMNQACTRAAAMLHTAGIPAASQLLGSGSGNDSLSLLVGTWAELKPVIAAALVQKGPQRSGVYARFNSAGQLQLLDPRGHVARTLGSGAGLIAATRDNVSAPVWLVTGTNAAGVKAAAGALTPARLKDHFALAVQPSGADLPVPARGTT
jgi:Domain of unknown function (DUF4430)